MWGSSARVRARERAQLSHNTPKHNEHSRYLFSASSPSFSFHGAVVFLAQAYAPWVATVTYKMQPGSLEHGRCARVNYIEFSGRQKVMSGPGLK